MTWLALDMDEGLLGAYRTRREAVAEHNDAEVLQRHKYGRGAYEYVFGFPGEDFVDTVYIEREEVASNSGGWDLTEWIAAGRPLGRKE